MGNVECADLEVTFLVFLEQVIKAMEHVARPCIVSYEGGFSASLEVSRLKRDEIPGLPEDLLAILETRNLDRE